MYFVNIFRRIGIHHLPRHVIRTASLFKLILCICNPASQTVTGICRHNRIIFHRYIFCTAAATASQSQSRAADSRPAQNPRPPAFFIFIIIKRFFIADNFLRTCRPPTLQKLAIFFKHTVCTGMARISPAHPKRIIRHIIVSFNRDTKPRIAIRINRINIKPAINRFPQKADFPFACQIIHLVKIARRQSAACRHCAAGRQKGNA